MDYVCESTPKSTRYSSRVAYLESTHKFMGIALLALTLALICVLFWSADMHRTYVNQPVRFVGINSETGEAYALKPNAIQVNPGEAAVRHFLSEFVILHCQRIIGDPQHPRVDEDYAKSLVFMDGRLTTTAAQVPTVEDIKKVKQGQSPEVKVNTFNVIIDEATNDCLSYSRPCHATVPFERVALNRGIDTAAETRKASARISFIRDKKAAADWKNNPMGMIVTNYKEYVQ